VITSFCFLIVVDLWCTVPETAGMALLYIPIMNGFGCTLLLTWIGFYRMSSVGILLIFIVVFLSSFLALEILFEFTGLNRMVLGYLQIILGLTFPIMSFTHLYLVVRERQV
jgi:hypothetical protein